MSNRRIEQHKRSVFLEAYRQGGNIAAAARACDVPRSTIYWWQEHDEAFAVQMRIAEVEAIESLEAEARRRAVAGSDLLLIFLLKAARPEKYRDRYDVTTGGAPITPLTVIVQEVPDRVGSS